MIQHTLNIFTGSPRKGAYPLRHRVVALLMIAVMLVPDCVQTMRAAQELQVSPDDEVTVVNEVSLDDQTPLIDATAALPTDSALNVVVDPTSPYGLDGKKIFNPDPTRAVWLSALCPGLGQIYNRRYWKLPIIIGGFMGLGYATSWNNSQFQDYSQAYRDLLDSDPNTKSYMNFFPPTTQEADLDQTWLTSVMKSRKDYFRRNRDLCIIGIVALYLVCMVDAYVDASLAHFDISPNLSMDVQPAVFVEPSSRKTALGLNWAVNF